MDPPYVPINATSFTEYTKGEFKHNELFTKIKNIINPWLLSNADVPFVNDTFEDYRIEVIECRRAINSKDPSSKVTEVLISSP